MTSPEKRLQEIIGRLSPGDSCCISLAPGVVLRADSALGDAWLDMRIWPIEEGIGT